MINIAIIEDDVIITEVISSYLSKQDDMCVIGKYSSMQDFDNSKSLANAEADIVLLDILMPGKSGIDGIKLIKQQWPKSNIIMLSVMDDGNSIFRALCEGAVGYIIKESSMQSIKTAITDVYEGKGSMSPSIARKVAEYFHPKKTVQKTLTPREVEIMNGIVEGLSYKLLAAKLEISIDTVRKHIKSIYKKLEINSRTQLIKKYYN